MTSYDPEAIYQDADLEMLEYQQIAAENDAALKAGNCRHRGGRYLYKNPPAYPEQEGLVYGQARCMDCGEIIEEPRCVEDGCDRVAVNRGWCDTHWAVEYDRRHRRSHRR